MKKKSIYCWLCAAALLMTGATSCVNHIQDDEPGGSTEGTVKMKFRTAIEKKPMSRATLKDAFSVLDYRRISDGKITHTVTQDAKNASFGQIEDVIPFGKHQFLFVGHQSEITSLEADGIAGFSRVTDTFSAQLELDVNAQTAASQQINLERRVAKLELVCSDALPRDLKEMEIRLEGASVTLDVKTGKGGVITTQEKVIQVPAGNLGVKNCKFSTFVFLPNETGTVKVTATAKGEGGKIIHSQVFESVEMQTNYITRYTGNMFSSGSSFQITVNSEWAGTKDFPF